MLFRDKLNEIGKKLSPEFDRLFEKIIEKQSHDGDLILILENGLYNPEVHTWTNLEEKLSPYMIGPSHEGHSSNTHYKFIHTYRSNAVADITFEEYLKESRFFYRADFVEQANLKQLPMNSDRCCKNRL